jgi:hypothetical protein
LSRTERSGRTPDGARQVGAATPAATRRSRYAAGGQPAGDDGWLSRASAQPACVTERSPPSVCCTGASAARFSAGRGIRIVAACLATIALVWVEPPPGSAPVTRSRSPARPSPDRAEVDDRTSARRCRDRSYRT